MRPVRADLVGGALMALLAVCRAEGATLSRVQRGLATLVGTQTFATTAVSPVDPARTLLLVNATAANEVPSQALASARLDGTGALQFERLQGANNVNVELEWTLLEFATGVTVQRGSDPLTGLSTAVPLSPVDLTKSFPVLTFRSTGGFTHGGHFVRARLSSSTSLLLEVSSAPEPNAVVEWQVARLAAGVWSVRVLVRHRHRLAEHQRPGSGRLYSLRPPVCERDRPRLPLGRRRAAPLRCGLHSSRPQRHALPGRDAVRDGDLRERRLLRPRLHEPVRGLLAHAQRRSGRGVRRPECGECLPRGGGRM
jgi:hypothetical protein